MERVKCYLTPLGYRCLDCPIAREALERAVDQGVVNEKYVVTWLACDSVYPDGQLVIRRAFRDEVTIEGLDYTKANCRSYKTCS